MSANEQAQERRERLALVAGILRDAAAIRGREVIPRTIHPALQASPAWTLSVPGGCVWMPLAMRMLYTPDPGQVNPVYQLYYGDTSGPYSMAMTSQLPLSGGDVEISFVRGLSVNATDANGRFASSPLPNIPLLGGDLITCGLSASMAGDTVTGVAVRLLEVWERNVEVEAEQDISRLLTMEGNAFPELREFL